MRKLVTRINYLHGSSQEVIQMAKSRDTKKAETKKPRKTAKEKKQAKRDKKNK